MHGGALSARGTIGLPTYWLREDTHLVRDGLKSKSGLALGHSAHLPPGKGCDGSRASEQTVSIVACPEEHGSWPLCLSACGQNVLATALPALDKGRYRLYKYSGFAQRESDPR